ncbi:DUF2914 domain-containing protein [Geobacter sp. AOG1]|uniref:DUF2914 domain-containing protein n=1 Tax=Geobacter sp. AOG1 TaxID=1566346 RepID=UPI001CC45B7B|nr:DUF2914 domain-containing protein [Geobacter sp. AOG1]GFE58262.1 hypothetical protein AOG1_21420 [Geobacter sp. AOG1]
MKYFLSVACLLLVIVCGGQAKAAEAGIKITEMAVTTKIVRGNPIDSVRRISWRSVPALFCFTRLVSRDGGEQFITHVWYRNDVKMAEYKLPVRGERWRTYSKKAVDRESPGEWRVDALDAGGNLLKSVKFKVN